MADTDLQVLYGEISCTIWRELAFSINLKEENAWREIFGKLTVKYINRHLHSAIQAQDVDIHLFNFDTFMIFSLDDWELVVILS